MLTSDEVKKKWYYKRTASSSLYLLLLLFASTQILQRKDVSSIYSCFFFFSLLMQMRRKSYGGTCVFEYTYILYLWPVKGWESEAKDKIREVVESKKKITNIMEGNNAFCQAGDIFRIESSNISKMHIHIVRTFSCRMLLRRKNQRKRNETHIKM